MWPLLLDVSEVRHKAQTAVGYDHSFARLDRDWQIVFGSEFNAMFASMGCEQFFLFSHVIESSRVPVAAQ